MVATYVKSHRNENFSMKFLTLWNGIIYRVYVSICLQLCMLKISGNCDSILLYYSVILDRLNAKNQVVAKKKIHLFFQGEQSWSVSRLGWINLCRFTSSNRTFLFLMTHAYNVCTSTSLVWMHQYIAFSYIKILINNYI